MPTAVKIGDAARQTHLSVDAIRFYQREGLLRHTARTEGGFRLFGAEDIQNLQFIRKAHQLGFSLAEIRELLLLQSEQVDACFHVQELLQKKLGAVLTKITELRKLEQRLRHSLRRCKRDLQAKGRADHQDCTFLAEFKSNDKGLQ